MRTILDGELWLSYSQAYVTSGGAEHPQLDTCFSGQVNGLLGAALPGCLHLMTGLHTGRVRMTVEQHDREPPLDDGWEEVVEASFEPDGETAGIGGCMGDVHEFALPSVSYRARYCAFGMDAGRAADVRSAGEPEIDRYLLQLWPAPPAPDRIVRSTSDIAAYWHGIALTQPAPEVIAARRRAEAEAAAAERAAAEERFRLMREAAVWGGPRPAGPLGSTPEAAPVAQVDRALAEELAVLPPDRRGPVARWAARAALAEADLDGIDWVVAAVAALDAGAALPPPFDDPAGPVQLLFSDPRVPQRVVTSPDGRVPNLSQQAMALHALITAADPDPVRALFVAVQHAQLAFGRDRLDVLHGALRTELRSALR